MDIKEINQMLDAHTVLNLIGYENSCPTISGQEIRDFCPIHGGDKKQSLAINTLTKTFKCHSCGAHGDLIGLYAQAKRITDIESAKQLDQGFTPSTKIFESNKTITNKPQQKTYTYQDVIDCWNNAKETGADTYFKDKYLPAPPIAKFGKNPKGYDGTMIPRTDIKGNFRGVISLNAKNKTKFIYKANEDEALPCFTQLGILDNQTQEMYIGEGIATVQTPWEATDRQIPGVSAGTWSNILPALKSIKQEYPQIKPIVIIDLDDDGNGLKAARQVQEAFPDATFRAPDFKGLKNNSSEKLKDFNDLVSKCGLMFMNVKEQLKKELMLPVDITPAQKIETQNSIQHEIKDNAVKVDIKFLSEEPINFLTNEAPPIPALLSIPNGTTEATTILPKGVVGMVVGAGGVGKTHFLSQLALAKANGDLFLGKYLVNGKGNVFLALGENTKEDIHRLLRKTYKKMYPNIEDQAYKSDSIQRLAIISVMGMKASLIDKENNPTKFYNDLLSKLKEKEPQSGWDLIILDPISRFLGPKAETDNDAATQFISLLERICLELKGKPTILFGHHMNKSGISGTGTDQTAARGSSGITDGTRWQANLELIATAADAKVYEPCAIMFRHVKSNHTAIAPAERLIRDGFGSLTVDTDSRIPINKSPKNKKIKKQEEDEFDKLAGK